MSQARLADIWVYLSASPLLHLTMTVAAYLVSDWIYRKSGNRSLLHPVLVSVMLLVAILAVTRTGYVQYFQGAQFVHFFLGPATVALAIPLYHNVGKLKKRWLPISLGLLVGSVTAALSAVALGWLFGASPQTLLALAPKSVTAPVAMGIAEKLGGLPSLTAVLVILTGILGSMIGPPLLNLFGIRDWAARGFAIGTASHGIGTARALQVNELAGAFSGLAMGLNGLATAILVPLIIALFL